MKLWAIFDAQGRATHVDIAAPDRATLAAQMSTAGCTVVEQPRALAADQFERITVGGEIAVNLDRARSWAIGRIEARRQARTADAVTPGAEAAYRRKAAEVDDYFALTAPALAAIIPAARAARWPYLTRAAELRGLSMTTIAQEIRAARAASDAKLSRVEAGVDAAKAAIRAAVTVAAIDAALSNEWSE